MLRTIFVTLFVLALVSAQEGSYETEYILARFDENTVLNVTRAEAFKIATILGRTIGPGFFDVTENDPKPKNPSVKLYPTGPTQQAIINPRLPALTCQQGMTCQLQSDLNSLTSFNNRYYTSVTGVEAAEWIRDQFTFIANNRPGIDVNFFVHPAWNQPSVIATIYGLTDERVILGAHEDSINSNSPGPVASRRAPGADDDGSGIVNLLGIWRALMIALSNGFVPQRTIQLMAYAAEEVGLRGSAGIAASYAAQGIEVYSTFQIDMSGFLYDASDASLTLIQDFTTPALNTFVAALVDEYVEIPYRTGTCGYACSDHASWYRNGYPASFAIEAAPSTGRTDPYIHTDQDIATRLNYPFMSQFSRLGFAIAIECSQATS